LLLSHPCSPLRMRGWIDCSRRKFLEDICTGMWHRQKLLIKAPWRIESRLELQHPKELLQCGGAARILSGKSVTSGRCYGYNVAPGGAAKRSKDHTLKLDKQPIGNLFLNLFISKGTWKNSSSDPRLRCRNFHTLQLPARCNDLLPGGNTLTIFSRYFWGLVKIGTKWNQINLLSGAIICLYLYRNSWPEVNSYPILFKMGCITRYLMQFFFFPRNTITTGSFFEVGSRPSIATRIFFIMR